MASSSPSGSSKRRKLINELPNFQGEHTRVIVGRELRVFHVLRDLLIKSSEFFAEALTKKPGRAEKYTVTVPDIVSYTFNIYVGFLYLGEAHTNSVSDVGPGVDREWGRLFELYLLGNTIRDRRFRNHIMDLFMQKMVDEKTVAPSLAGRAWKLLPQSSPLQRFLVDAYVYIGDDEWFRGGDADVEAGGGAPRGFWLEVARKAIRELAAGNRSSKKELLKRCCDYHEHVKGEPKCLTGHVS